MSEDEDPDIRIIKARKMKELTETSCHTREDQSKETAGKSAPNR